jgi:hypothetical protein
MTKACAAQSIGSDAWMLVALIAHQEDAVRYRRAVSFYNVQLMMVCGFPKEDRLVRARHSAIEAGWLHYEPGCKRKPGIYWSNIPETYCDPNDAPIDEDHVQDSPPLSPPDLGGKVGGETEENRGEKPRENTGLSSLSPSPTPSPKKKPSTITSADVEFPTELDDPDCRDALDRWLAHKLELGKPYKGATSVKTLLKSWAKAGPEAFRKAVDHSLARNWEGIFSPGDSDDRKRKAPTRADAESTRRGLQHDPDADVDKSVFA